MSDVELVERAARALAEALPIRSLVLVSPTHPARTLWHDRAFDSAQNDALVALGRGLLDASQPAELGTVRGSILGLVITDGEASCRAVLLAVLADGEQWTDVRRRVVSFGVEVVRDDLLRLADRPKPSHADQTSNPRLEAQLRTAAVKGELTLLYQPEVDMRSGVILAVEALVRWDHPERGRLGPDSFIGVAERSDVIKVLGSWVIDQALRDLAGWDAADLTLRINVSPAQLSGDGVVGQLAGALQEHGLTGSQVCVEFTETAAGVDPVDLAGTARALSELGVRTAIDDLATGYSTLSRLRTLPVDSVKIDRSLVAGIDGDPRAQAIVGALIRMADDLGVEIIAEGVENAAEARTLLALGCFRAQGHWFALPQTAEAVAASLRDSSTGTSAGSLD